MRLCVCIRTELKLKKPLKRNRGQRDQGSAL
nr:MAG TPA: hypothetical protein [Caudoviricetes sp.]